MQCFRGQESALSLVNHRVSDLLRLDDCIPEDVFQVASLLPGRLLSLTICCTASAALLSFAFTTVLVGLLVGLCCGTITLVACGGVLGLARSAFARPWRALLLVSAAIGCGGRRLFFGIRGYHGLILFIWRARRFSCAAFHICNM